MDAVRTHDPFGWPYPDPIEGTHEHSPSPEWTYECPKVLTLPHNAGDIRHRIGICLWCREVAHTAVRCRHGVRREHTPWVSNLRAEQDAQGHAERLPPSTDSGHAKVPHAGNDDCDRSGGHDEPVHVVTMESIDVPLDGGQATVGHDVALCPICRHVLHSMHVAVDGNAGHRTSWVSNTWAVEHAARLMFGTDPVENLRQSQEKARIAIDAALIQTRYLERWESRQKA